MDICVHTHMDTYMHTYKQTDRDYIITHCSCPEYG